MSAETDILQKLAQESMYRDDARTELLRYPLPERYDTEAFIAEVAELADVSTETARAEFWQCVRRGEIELPAR